MVVSVLTRTDPRASWFHRDRQLTESPYNYSPERLDFIIILNHLSSVLYFVHLQLP